MKSKRSPPKSTRSCDSTTFWSLYLRQKIFYAFPFRACADFAKPAVKNSYNGSLNPIAQHRKPLTIEEVVQSRVIVDPLTLLMCSVADAL